MTTEQLHRSEALLSSVGRGSVAALIFALCIIVSGFSGCSAKERYELTPPHVLLSPYPQEDRVWAVAPLVNESGVSVVDSLAVSDELAGAITETRGLSAVPVNRVLAAMDSLGMSRVASVEDASRLSEALGVSGLVSGSITSYDPYDPPVLGLALALHVRDGRGTWRSVDPAILQTAYGAPRGRGSAGGLPAGAIAVHLSGANHETRMAVRRFATGRHDGDTALGWERYLASMELFTRFAAWHTMEKLLENERLRLVGVGSSGSDPAGR